MARPRVKGYYKTKKGHLRYSSGPLRGQYVHRVVVKNLLAETHPLTIAVLPAFELMEIHHIDHRHDHNCPCNLLILDTPLHSMITEATMPRRNGQNFASKSKAPEWVEESKDDSVSDEREDRWD
jgi:hypothetical protein